MEKSSSFRNDFLFDCRKYIKPGDRICYDSMFACPNADKVQRHESIPHRATVTAVYEAFVAVRLRKVTETVNRWDIISVNGTPLKRGRYERSGAFVALEAPEEVSP